MKKFLSLIFGVAVSLSLLSPSLAQTQTSTQLPEPTPEQIELAANAVSAMVIGWFVVPAVVITGKQQEFCEFIGGKYDENGGDICPGGDWWRAALAFKYLFDSESK